jgi:two-component system OmpR family sensor kinase
MRRSLRLRLTLLLGGTILLAALVATSAAFLLAYREATEFQDDLLRQIAVLADTDSPPHSTSDASARPPLSDPDSRISVIRLPADPRPDWLPERLAAGFHQVEAKPGPQRVFVRDYENLGRRIVVAQPTETRDEIALDSAIQTLVPLVLLLPVIAWLILRIVRHELVPIDHLARHLDAQPADRPGPLADAKVPEEIRPFVQAINRLLERVAELVQQQRRFIADAAHEIRSPLTALSVQAQNLSQAQTLEAARERMRPLQAGIDRAQRLAEQLLSLARLQAGSLPTQEVDLSGLARELIAEQMPFAEARGIDLGLEECAPVRIAATPDSLRLVLRNGLENALKYGRDGGEVTVRIAADSEYAIIEVVDDGPGIPATERARVLEPFRRLEHAGGTGSGLGLSIAREAAARVGGKLELAPRRGAPGLIFRYRQRRVLSGSPSGDA